MRELPSVRRLVIAQALVCAVTACGGAGGSSIPTGTALGQDASSGADPLGMGVTSAQPGEPIFAALWQLSSDGTHRVHLKSAEVLGVPNGLVVDGVYAVWGSGRFAFTEWGGDAGKTAPISSIVLDPTCPPSAECGPRLPPPNTDRRYQHWIVTIQAHISRPGHYATKDIRMRYDVDGHEYQQTFPYFIVADSGRGNSPSPPP